MGILRENTQIGTLQTLGWRCRNEHAEKSENIEKEKLANQSAIKQQGSLSKNLKKTSGYSSYWVINGYCAPRLT